MANEYSAAGSRLDWDLAAACARRLVDDAQKRMGELEKALDNLGARTEPADMVTTMLEQALEVAGVTLAARLQAWANLPSADSDTIAAYVAEQERYVRAQTELSGQYGEYGDFEQ